MGVTVPAMNFRGASLLPFLALGLMLVVVRVLGAGTLGGLSNLQPFGALFFCAAACAGSRWLWVAALAWIATVPVTSAINGYSWTFHLLTPMVGFAALVAIGRSFRGKATGVVFGGSLLGGLAFYLITNVLAWATSGFYAKTLAGLTQALWTGTPGYPPTYLFFRNEMLAQALFSGVFLLAWGGVRQASALRLRQAEA